jgi:hypothetical protein
MSLLGAVRAVALWEGSRSEETLRDQLFWAYPEARGEGAGRKVVRWDSCHRHVSYSMPVYMYRNVDDFVSLTQPYVWFKGMPPSLALSTCLRHFIEPQPLHGIPRRAKQEENPTIRLAHSVPRSRCIFRVTRTKSSFPEKAVSTGEGQAT